MTYNLTCELIRNLAQLLPFTIDSSSSRAPAARSTTTRPENISLTVETDRSPPRYTMYYCAPKLIQNVRDIW